MNIWREALLRRRRYLLWKQYGIDRLRWRIRERNNPLGKKQFRLGEKEYPYFLHPYNHTWANERAVEIPVVNEYLKACDPFSTLEIGNVLSHYVDPGHTVLDKYEKCSYRPVINEDLVEYDPRRRFSLIVSVSTIEHVGWDERPKEEAKVMMALEKIRSLLAPGGKALITVPTGYNRYLDQHIHGVLDNGASLHCLKRVSKENEWVQTNLDDALQCKYGTPFQTAGAILFLYLAGDAEAGDA